MSLDKNKEPNPGATAINGQRTALQSQWYGALEDAGFAGRAPSVQTCTDNEHNGLERGVDCGGPDCLSAPCDVPLMVDRFEILAVPGGGARLRLELSTAVQLPLNPTHLALAGLPLTGGFGLSINKQEDVLELLLLPEDLRALSAVVATSADAVLTYSADLIDDFQGRSIQPRLAANALAPALVTADFVAPVVASAALDMSGPRPWHLLLQFSEPVVYNESLLLEPWLTLHSLPIVPISTTQPSNSSLAMQLDTTTADRLFQLQVAGNRSSFSLTWLAPDALVDQVGLPVRPTPTVALVVAPPRPLLQITQVSAPDLSARTLVVQWSRPFAFTNQEGAGLDLFNTVLQPPTDVQVVAGADNTMLFLFPTTQALQAVTHIMFTNQSNTLVRDANGNPALADVSIPMPLPARPVYPCRPYDPVRVSVLVDASDDVSAAEFASLRQVAAAVLDATASALSPLGFAVGLVASNISWVTGPILEVDRPAWPGVRSLGAALQASIAAPASLPGDDDAFYFQQDVSRLHHVIIVLSAGPPSDLLPASLPSNVSVLWVGVQPEAVVAWPPATAWRVPAWEGTQWRSLLHASVVCQPNQIYYTLDLVAGTMDLQFSGHVGLNASLPPPGALQFSSRAHPDRAVPVTCVAVVPLVDALRCILSDDTLAGAWHQLGPHTLTNLVMDVAADGLLDMNLELVPAALALQPEALHAAAHLPRIDPQLSLQLATDVNAMLPTWPAPERPEPAQAVFHVAPTAPGTPSVTGIVDVLLFGDTPLAKERAITAAQTVAPVSSSAWSVTLLGHAEVWWDRPTVSFVVRASAPQPAEATALLALGPDHTAEASCLLQTPTFACILRVDVPAPWFLLHSSPQPIAWTLGTATGQVALMPAPAVLAMPEPSAGPQLTVLAPAAALVPGQSATIQVSLTSALQAKTFRVLLAVDPSVAAIVAVETNATLWDLSSLILPEDGQVSVVGLLSAQGLAEFANTPAWASRLLFEVRVTAKTQTETVAGRVNATAIECTDVAGVRLLDQAAAQVYARGHQGQAMANIHVALITLQALVPVAAQRALLNTALLTRQRVAIDLDFFAVYNGTEPEFFPLHPSAVLCSSANTSALKVTPDCAQVYVDGSEVVDPAGHADVAVEVSMQSLSAQLAFDVYVPEVTLVAQTTTLHALPAGRWQGIDLQVRAAFHAPGQPDRVFDVTRALAHDAVSVSNPSVLALQRQWHVRALQPGTATVRVTGPSSQALAQLTVTVIGTVVSPLGLAVVPVVPARALEYYSDNVTVHLGAESRDLLYDMEEAVVSMYLVLPDNITMSLDPVLDAADVTLAFSHPVLTLAPNWTAQVVMEEAQHPVTVLAHAQWRGLVAGYATLRVDVQVPEDLEIVLDSSALLLPDLAAVAATWPSQHRYPTSTKWAVWAVYAGQVRVDVTQSAQLAVQLVQASVVAQLYRSSAQITAAAAGTATLTVELSGVHAQVNVQVIGIDALMVRATPFPPYMGSADVEMTSLHPLANTHPVLFQRAQLSVQLTLTNGGTVDITSDPALLINVTDNLASLQATQGALVVAPTGASGLLVISASYASRDTRLELISSSTPLYPVGLRQGRLLGADDSTFLGPLGATAQVRRRRGGGGGGKIRIMKNDEE